MPLFKFEEFIFDSTRHSLSYKGTKVAIRPKALKLLNLLIQNRHRMLSKAEIMSSVWGSDYARDHLLFQLIGELRKPPFKGEFVRTQPNEGYQWNVSTKTINKRLFVPHMLAASVVAALMCLSLITSHGLDKVDANRTQTLQLPAYNALSKGIIALGNGEKDKAIQWFEFALLENPDSIESSIFLADTLYQQNRSEESLVYLQNILGSENLSAYNKATATHILSRISEQQGKFEDALQYAQKSALTKVAGQCSIDFVEQRVQGLESRVAMSPIRSERDQAEVETETKEVVAISKNYVNQCNELKNIPTEISSCPPLKYESIAYRANIGNLIIRVS